MNIPEIDSKWRHTNGNRYTVLLVANIYAEKTEEYPVTIVYQEDSNNLVWSRTLPNWYRSMTPVVEGKSK